jgi:hypothetical protein
MPTGSPHPAARRGALRGAVDADATHLCLQRAAAGTSSAERVPRARALQTQGGQHTHPRTARRRDDAVDKQAGAGTARQVLPAERLSLARLDSAPPCHSVGSAPGGSSGAAGAPLFNPGTLLPCSRPASCDGAAPTCMQLGRARPSTNTAVPLASAPTRCWVASLPLARRPALQSCRGFRWQMANEAATFQKPAYFAAKRAARIWSS